MENARFAKRSSCAVEKILGKRRQGCAVKVVRRSIFSPLGWNKPCSLAVFYGVPTIRRHIIGHHVHDPH
jgi:hypothetical protein